MHLLGLLDGLALARILSDTVTNVLQVVNLVVRTCNVSAYLVVRAVLQKHLHDRCDAYSELARALLNLWRGEIDTRAGGEAHKVGSNVDHRGAPTIEPEYLIRELDGLVAFDIRVLCWGQK